MNTRNVVERLGLLMLAFGVTMATLLAWLLTKVHWSWATQTGVHTAFYGTSRAAMIQSLGDSYSYEHHVAAQGSFYIGIVFAVVGIVCVLVGKATGRPTVD